MAGKGVSATQGLDLSLVIKSPPSRVLKAFFDADALGAWWQVAHSVTTPRVLGPYAIEWALTDFRDVSRQLIRNRSAFGAKPQDMPVFGTSAATFNDNGVTALYQHLAGLRKELQPWGEGGGVAHFADTEDNGFIRVRRECPLVHLVCDKSHGMILTIGQRPLLYLLCRRDARERHSSGHHRK